MTDLAEQVAAYTGLPREDRGPILSCIHPDRAQQCDEEAAWYVWDGSAWVYPDPKIPEPSPYERGHLDRFQDRHSQWRHRS